MNNIRYLRHVKRACEYIKKETFAHNFNVAVIFGSGLSPDEDILRGKSISYNDIPFYPKPTVHGHTGRLVHTFINDKSILFFLGRLHYYEGYSTREITFPVRILKELGVDVLLITNAAGAVNKRYKSGDLMIINGHINLTGTNPLIGPNIDEHGERFVDLAESYSPRLNKIIKKSSSNDIKEGVYVGVAGPTYESYSEIKFFRTIGGDAVGMSTVFENIVACHCGIETAGISCIVNEALDVSKKEITHEKVVETAKKSETKLLNLIKNFIGNI